MLGFFTTKRPLPTSGGIGSSNLPPRSPSVASSAPSPLDSLLLELDTYSMQLKTLSSATAHALYGMETCASSLMTLVEAIVPLAGTHGGLPGPAAELLLGATSLVSTLLPQLAQCLNTLALTPLSAILASHAELQTRAEEREKAAAEYAVASSDLAALKRRVATKGKLGLGTVMGGAGSGGGGTGAGEAEGGAMGGASSSGAAMKRVVNRLLASQALVEALEGGLLEELTAMGDRRRLVTGRLFQGISASLEAFGEGVAAAFPFGGAGSRSGSSSSGSTSPAMQSIIEISAGSQEWYDEGTASRAKSRAQAAAHKEAIRKSLDAALPREIPLASLVPSSYSLTAIAGSGSANGGASSAAPKATASRLVLEDCAHAVLPRVLQALPVLEVLRLCSVSKAWNSAIAGLGSGLRSASEHGGFSYHAPGRDKLQAAPLHAQRLRFWGRRLSVPHSVLSGSAFAGGEAMGVARAPPLPSYTIASRESFLALVQLALAEGVEGGKGSSTPASATQGGGRGEGEGGALPPPPFSSFPPSSSPSSSSWEPPLHSLPRWMTLIEQDVARSYNAGLPFGLTGTLLQGKRRVLGPWRQLCVGALEWGDAAAAAQLRGHALERWRAVYGGRRGQGKARLHGASQARSRGRSLPPRVHEEAAGGVQCTRVKGGIGWGTAGSPPANASRAPPGSKARRAPRRTSAFSDLLLAPPSSPGQEEGGGGAQMQGEFSGGGAALGGAEAEAEAEVLRVSLQGVLLCVAALEPELRYTQGIHALGRVCLHVAYEGLAGLAQQQQQQALPSASALGAVVSRARTLSSSSLAPQGFTFSLLSSLPPRRQAAAVVATNLLHALLRDGPRGAPRLLPLFLPDTRGLRLRLYQMGRLLLRRQPGLHSTLMALGVPPSSYASPWLLTLFGNFTALDPAGTVRLWEAALCGQGGGSESVWWCVMLGGCLAVMDALAPLIVGGERAAALEDALPPLRTPRLYYAQARQQGGVVGGGGGVWRQACCAATTNRGSLECIVRYALTSEACRVTPAELEELQENFFSLGHLDDDTQ